MTSNMHSISHGLVVGASAGFGITAAARSGDYLIGFAVWLFVLLAGQGAIDFARWWAERRGRDE